MHSMPRTRRVVFFFQTRVTFVILGQVFCPEVSVTGFCVSNKQCRKEEKNVFCSFVFWQNFQKVLVECYLSKKKQKTTILSCRNPSNISDKKNVFCSVFDRGGITTGSSCQFLNSVFCFLKDERSF